MKILFLLTQDLDSPAGYGRYFPIARELHSLGHHVEIAGLHPQYSSLHNKHYDLDGVKIHHVAPMHVMKSRFLKSYYPGWKLAFISIQASIALARMAFRIKPEVIHIGKPHPMNSIAGLLTCLLRGGALALDIDDYEEAIGRFSSHFQRAIVSLFERKMPARVKLVTTNTRFNQKRLRTSGIPSDRIFYLPNGIDKDRFANIPEENIRHHIQSLGLQGKRVIAYIGSLSRPSHAVDLLLPTLQHILHSEPAAVLLAVGAGEALPDLLATAKEMRINDHVRFTGWVSPDSVPQYYAIAEVCIDPVMNDDAARGRSPLKLLESWASGTPFVTGDVGDRRELMGAPLAGVLVDPGNPESLARGVLQVLTDPSSAARIRAAGLLRADDYNWTRISSELESAYERIR
jgi:glycosyltransferase involved in cell wall biosynthesis